MVAIVEVKAELAKLTPAGLSPQSTAVAREASFAKLAVLRDGGLFSAKFIGENPWELTPAAMNSCISSRARRPFTS